MCGFSGFIDKSFFLQSNEWPSTLGRMGEAIAHRGPDDGGIWFDADAGIGMSHRRLSILDLSPAGHQPMASRSGRFVIAFNGEIYNHLELRQVLDAESRTLSEDGGEKRVWRGHSDTETLLAGIEAWGIDATVKKAVGMFAFALWDRTERVLTLARDRLGEKPLYYGWQNDVFLFGSELKALKVHSAFRGEIDRDALTLFLRYSYVPTPYSIYKGVHKLRPGSYIQFAAARGQPAEVAYWSASTVAKSGIENVFEGSESEATETLERLISQSVAGQKIADVPLGAFLSGGIDSSTVVALMQAQSETPVKTFTIGFHEKGFNEAEHAKAIARHLGTEHTELYVTSEEARKIIPSLSTIYDEPFADSSQIPTLLVSQLARHHVKVGLSGDGGDELFGGYNRYMWVTQLSRKFPFPLRKVAARVLTTLSPNAWTHIADAIGNLMPSRYRYSNSGDKLHKLAEVLSLNGTHEIYHSLVSQWKNPSAVVIGGNERIAPAIDTTVWASVSAVENSMMLLDLVSYLLDDLLVKVDRAAMSVSLESRIPLLDHRVVEFAWQTPLSMKIRDGQGKWLLRQVLKKYVPEEMTDRPKMGFGVPIGDWLRGPLREWAEELLDPKRMEREAFFHADCVREKWTEHLSGRRNWAYQLWNVLMFQAWLDIESSN